jgi:hypothetical protein
VAGQQPDNDKVFGPGGAGRMGPFAENTHDSFRLLALVFTPLPLLSKGRPTHLLASVRCN